MNASLCHTVIHHTDSVCDVTYPYTSLLYLVSKRAFPRVLSGACLCRQFRVCKIGIGPLAVSMECPSSVPSSRCRLLPLSAGHAAHLSQLEKPCKLDLGSRTRCQQPPNHSHSASFIPPGLLTPPQYSSAKVDPSPTFVNCSNMVGKPSPPAVLCQGHSCRPGLLV